MILCIFFEDGTKMKVPAENKPPLNLNQTVNTEKQQNVCVLLGSYYKYWPYKCFDPYFLDQPVLTYNRKSSTHSSKKTE